MKSSEAPGDSLKELLKLPVLFVLLLSLIHLKQPDTNKQSILHTVSFTVFQVC